MGAPGVTLCCVSLPQSQGNNSKNSVVSSSSTKDSSMSSSAPMVPHLCLVSFTLLFMASFYCFHLFCLIWSPYIFVHSYVKWLFSVFLYVLYLVYHPLHLCFCFEHKLWYWQLIWRLENLTTGLWLKESLLACVLPIPPVNDTHIYLLSAQHWQVDKWLSFCGITADTSVGSAHILVASLCVQLCHLSFVDDLAVVVGVIAMPWKATLENSGKS